MLVSQRDDHKRNFLRTRDLAITLETAISTNNTTSPLHNFGPSLLRFYAAESGLKYLLNRKENIPFDYEVQDTNAPPDTVTSYPGKVEGYSHALNRMLCRLRVSAASVNIPTGPFHVTRGYKNGQTFELKAAQEAWRYGLEVCPADQLVLENFLAQVISYINGEV